MKSTPAKEFQQRNASADILKVLSIFSVVFIHGSSIVPVSSSNYDVSNTVISLTTHVFRFCVPVFIFLWAYFTEKSVLKTGKDNSIKRISKLLIPFFFWSSVYFLYTANFKELTLASIITKHWVGYGWSGQYYFVILFQLIFLFGIIRKFSLSLIKYRSWIIVGSTIFYCLISYSNWFDIGIIGKMSYRPFFYWLPYACLGIISAHKGIFNIEIPKRFIIFSPFLILAEIYLFNPSLANEYMLPSVFIASMLLASSIDSKLTYFELSPRLAQLIKTVANSTLGIFCLNPIVILLLSSIIHKTGIVLNGPGISVITAIISTLVIISICIMLINLLKKMKLGQLVSN